MKKNALLFFLVLLAIGIAFFYYNSKTTPTPREMPIIAEEKSLEIKKEASLPIVTPDLTNKENRSAPECLAFKNDTEVSQSAVENQKIEDCDCLSSKKAQLECKAIIFDIMLYTQALKQYSPEICDKINSPKKKLACKSVIQEGIEYMSKADNQKLANIYASADDPRAMDEYIKILEETPEDVSILINLAISYAEAGLAKQESGGAQDVFTRKALKTIDEAKKLAPANADVYRAEGYVYEIVPDLEKAISSYNKSLELNPQHISAYAGLGHVYTMKGDPTLAIKTFQRAARFDKQKLYIPIYSNLCRLGFLHTPDREKTLGYCQTVINSKTEDIGMKSEAHQLLADFYLMRLNYQKAKNHILTAQSMTPESANLLITLAKINLYEEDYIESEKNAQKAINLVPIKATPYLSLTQALYMQDKNKESIKSAEKGLSLIANDVSLLLNNKSLIQKSLYEMISYNYRELNQPEQQKKHEDLAKKLDKMS